MSLSKIALLLVFSLGSGMCYAEVYQWTDEQGTTHFSDKPVNNKAKKLDISAPSKHDSDVPVTVKDAKKNSETDGQATKDKDDSMVAEKETPKEKADKNREKLTEELIKAREIREAKRKKLKEEAENRLIQCQEETTKQALMKNELEEYDKKLKTMSRSERPKSNEFIMKTDLEVRMERQKEKVHELCD